METVRQILENILVYVIMMTVLQCLVTKEGFLEIFRFVSGLILILVCAASLLSLLAGDNTWYESLEEKVFQEDLEQLQEEMELSQGSLERVLLEQWKKQLEEQLEKTVEAKGEELQQVQVETEKNNEGEFCLKGLSIKLGQGNGNKKQNNRTAGKIKKIICEKYDLSSKAVKVWREK